MNTNYFHIEILEEGSILVIPTSYLRPEFYIEKIEKILLKKSKADTCIYFDFLIKNGTKDRFYKVLFQNERVILNSFTKIEDDSKLVCRSNPFFAKNFNLISESYLTKSQKFLLKRKLSVVEL